MTAPVETKKDERCLHPHKKRCGLCDELYCPGEKCDPYHIDACRDAGKP